MQKLYACFLFTFLICAFQTAQCQDTTGVNPKPQWLVPTGFSPNGDGINDYFHVVLRGPVELVFLRVFNRWGEKIFETNTVDPGWDGTYQERPQPVGVYVYQIQVRKTLNGVNTIVNESGNVTLIR